MNKLLRSAALLLVLALGAGIEARASGVPNVPPPTCAGCGAQSTSSGSISHRSGCPYGPRDRPPPPGPGDDRPALSPDQQANQILSLLFPIPAVGGVVFGGIWHVKRLCGGFKGKSAIRSWNDYILEHYPLGGKGASGGVWGRLGGLPFLVLYPATWSLGQLGLGLGWCGEKTGEGVAWLGGKTWQGISWPPKQIYYAVAGRPEDKPKPSLPQIQAAAANYGQLKKESARVLAETKEARLAATEKRDAFLDELIAGDPTLQQVLSAEGLAAARARAAKKLDAYLSSYRERARLRQNQEALIAGMNATIDKADLQLFEDAAGIVVDKISGRITGQWQAKRDSGRNTPAGYHNLRRNLHLADVAGKTKDLQGDYYDITGIHASLKKAEAGDHEAQLEAQEQIGRKLIAYLDMVVPGDIGAKGLVAMDAAYCATAHLVLGNMTADLRGDMLKGVSHKNDALALRWAKNQARTKAAANAERIAGVKQDFYSEMEQKYAKSATGKDGSK